MRRSSCPSVKRAKLQLQQGTATAKATATAISDTKDDPSSVTARDPPLTGVTRDNSVTNDTPQDGSVMRDVDDSRGYRDDDENNDVQDSRQKVGSIDDHLLAVTELESKNADKMAELKLLLRTSESMDHRALLLKGITSSTTPPLPCDAPSTKEETYLLETDDVEGDPRRWHRQQRVESLQEQLDRLKEVEEELDEEIGQREKKKSETHIHKLHEYNDLKDACQIVFGRLAELEQVTVKDVYKRYDLDIED